MMKKSLNASRTISYLAGCLTIAAAVAMAVFLFMSLFGLLHPRKTRITMETVNIAVLYDGEVHSGTTPFISHGQLLEGHTLETRSVVQHSQVGAYENAPVFVILDETGADVTQLYDIEYDFGELLIQPRTIFLKCDGTTKLYDGEPIYPGELAIISGDLVEGHTLKVERYNSLTYPDSVRVEPTYRIYTENGLDVTDQYYFSEFFGQLEVLPHELCISTGSAKKQYDGESLTKDEWKMTGGSLLPGHSLDVRVTGLLNDAGSIPNTAEAAVYDENGADVSRIYQFNFDFGQLDIHKIPLYIKTESAQKVYDGTPLSCDKWKITSGKLEDGAELTAAEIAKLDNVGTVENAIRFVVTNDQGINVTHRYEIVCDYGTLTLQSRSITIQTDSAKKSYDGTALQCNKYTILSGELCEGDVLELTCASITEIGYMDNAVYNYIVYRLNENGDKQDVTSYYRISIEYGKLEITP